MRSCRPPSTRTSRAHCRPAPHRALAVTWLPPPALRRSRPPPPWKPQAAGRVILACARAADAPARYRTHLARVRGDSVPHPTPESRPPATPEPHPTHRTRVLGARKVGSILGAHMPRTAAFRGGCPAAEAGAWPTHRAAELVQHGWVHTGLSPTSRRPPAAVLHPGHECSRAPWPTRAALGAPWCGPCGEGGDARVVDASDLRSVAMYGPKARAATVAESSSTLVGPQQRARAHHEEQPGDAASFGEGGR